MSIVIIIIGFLIAGISAGSNLIKQASLNSVINDMRGYQTSYNNFRIRYGVAPGDMINASNYFPTCGAGASNLFCDGNGDGLITTGAATGAAMVQYGGDESFKGWRQLSLAGMINTGIVSMFDNATAQTVGSTLPASKISGAGYILSGGSAGGSSIGYMTGGSVISPWTDGKTNAVFIGKPSTRGLPRAALTGEDAFNIDRKLDDGAVVGGNATGATTGRFRSVGEHPSVIVGNCAITTNYQIVSTVLTCISGYALN